VRIAELALRTGVPARLLRYYEEQGLLGPPRDSRGWRDYTDADEGRVREIRGLLDAGLPTAAIRQLLDCASPESASRAGIDEALLVGLVDVRNRLDARISCLSRNRDALDAWLRQNQQSVDRAGLEGGQPAAMTGDIRIERV